MPQPKANKSDLTLSSWIPKPIKKHPGWITFSLVVLAIVAGIALPHIGISVLSVVVTIATCLVIGTIAGVCIGWIKEHKEVRDRKKEIAALVSKDTKEFIDSEFTFEEYRQYLTNFHVNALNNETFRKHIFNTHISHAQFLELDGEHLEALTNPDICSLIPNPITFDQFLKLSRDYFEALKDAGVREFISGFITVEQFAKIHRGALWYLENPNFRSLMLKNHLTFDQFIKHDSLDGRQISQVISNPDIQALIINGIISSEQLYKLDKYNSCLFKDGLYHLHALENPGIRNFLIQGHISFDEFQKLSYKQMNMLAHCIKTLEVKLPSFVRDEAIKYLKTLPGANEDQNLIANLRQEGVKRIWDQIKPPVIAYIFSEFGPLDNCIIPYEKLIALIEQGKDQVKDFESIISNFLISDPRKRSGISTTGFFSTSSNLDSAESPPLPEFQKK